MAVRFTGMWGKVRDTLQNAKTFVAGPAEDALRRLGEAIETAVYDEMLSSNHAPNADATIDKKGFDLPWVESGAMRREGLTVRHTRGLFGAPTVFIVASEEPHPRPRTDSDAGITYADVFAILEHGSKKRRIPARPVFAPIASAVESGNDPRFQPLLEEIKAAIALKMRE